MRPLTFKRIFFWLGAIWATILLFSSCTKSALSPQGNATVKQTWIAVHGHDISSWAGAQFCAPGDSLGIETITLTFNNEPNDPNKFGLVPGSIYFPPNGRIPVTDSLYDRTYYKLLTLLPNE